ncbi:hypothetical protein M1N92_03750 [Dehalococcoidia bacterium]|nr:hypothetical protein [Dehalococcoidia bacterium]
MVMIMVTGYASVENAVRALNKGALAYITKPLNMDEVVSQVREVLEKQGQVMENRSTRGFSSPTTGSSTSSIPPPVWDLDWPFRGR